jgi:hypothetical protein
VSGLEEEEKPPKDRVKLVLSILLGLCLFSFYLAFLGLIGGAILLAPMSGVESLIFYTLILRVLGVAFVPQLRRTHAQVKIALFSLETFALVVLIFGFIITGQPYFDTLIGGVLTAWLGASSIVLTPYLIYQIGASIYKGMSTSALVLSVVPEFAVGAFLVGFGITNAGSVPAGISAFGTVLIGSVRAQTALQNEQAIASNAFIVGVSLIAFLAMLFHIGLKQRNQSPNFNDTDSLSKGSPRYHYQLVLILVSAIIVLSWMIISAATLGGDDLVVLSLPAVVISAVLWGFSRKGR